MAGDEKRLAFETLRDILASPESWWHLVRALGRNSVPMKATMGWRQSWYHER